MPRILYVLQMKREDILKFLAARTHAWLPNGTVHLHKEKWWHLHHKSENLGGTSVGRLCHCCHWKSSWCECHILQEAMLKFAAAPGATPIAGHFSPRTSLTRSGQPFRSQNFWWLQLLAETSCVHLPTVVLCSTDSVQRGEESGRCHPMQQESWLGGSDVVDTHPGKFCACMAPSPVNTDGRSCLIFTFTKILKRLKKKSRRQLRRLWPRRNFTVNRPLQLLSSLLLNLRWQTGLQACRCCGRLFGSFLLKPGMLSLPLQTTVQLPLPRPLKTQEGPLSSLKVFFHKLRRKEVGGK